MAPSSSYRNFTYPVARATSYVIDENGNSVLQTRSDGSPVRCQTDYNINIWNFPAPAEDDIKKLIEQSAPYDWFRLKIAVKNPNIDTSLSNVASLMNREFIAIKPVEPQDKQDSMTLYVLNYPPYVDTPFT